MLVDRELRTAFVADASDRLVAVVASNTKVDRPSIRQRQRYSLFQRNERMSGMQKVDSTVTIGASVPIRASETLVARSGNRRGAQVTGRVMYHFGRNLLRPLAVTLLWDQTQNKGNLQTQRTSFSVCAVAKPAPKVSSTSSVILDKKLSKSLLRV